MTRTTGPGREHASHSRRAAPPAQRLLETATELFAAQDIREVGIDRILAEAGVAKASLYNLYGSKEALVLAYLTALDQADRKRYHGAAARLDDPVEQILLFFDLAAAAARSAATADACMSTPPARMPVPNSSRWWRIGAGCIRRWRDYLLKLV